MSFIESFSAREIGNRDRLEDYAINQDIQTPGGLNLHLIMVSDGTGGGDAGERAARLTANTIIDFLEINDNLQSIPALLTAAIEEANRVVYEELSGRGSSTIALVAVDLNDGEYGRAYIASVGNSHIYLVRGGRMVRLNIDHTLANEYIYAGQMSENEAQRLENANYPTRVIGVNPEIQVDIGFYVEKGMPFVNSQRAFSIGKSGMLLYEGDTLFAATEGMFHQGQDGSEESVGRESDFLRYAMDIDVGNAVRSVMNIVSQRDPQDNISLSMMFVPSTYRKPVRDPINPWVRWAVGGLSTLLFGFVIFGGVFFYNSTAADRENNARNTQFFETIAALNATSTPTSSPTATSTPTATATVTPTIAAVSANQIGEQLLPEGNRGALLLNREVSSADFSYAIVLGIANNNGNFRDNIVPAAIFTKPDTNFRIPVVNDTIGFETFDLELGEKDIFVSTGDYRNEAVRGWLRNNDAVLLNSKTACFTAEQIAPNPNDPLDNEKLALTCYDNDLPGTCSYQLENQDAQDFETGTRVILDIEENVLISSSEYIYEDVKAYYNTILSFEFFNRVDCLIPYLDIDEDTIPYPDDLCEFESGTVQTNGCPDNDLDGIRNSIDECPNESGPIENDGCPLAATEVIDLDPDGDGLIETDKCPFEAGPEENNGCPIEPTSEGISLSGIIGRATETPIPTVRPSRTPRPNVIIDDNNNNNNNNNISSP